MKKCFLFLFLVAATNVFAQTTNFDEVRLKKDSDYAAANKYALEAASYVLSVPLDTNNAQRQKALQFAMKWMEGTPDFSFSLDATIMEKVVGDNNDLLGLYMVAMTKYSLENESNAKNDALIKLNAIKLVLAYVEKPENNVKMHKALRKLSDANKKGELEKAL